MLIFIQTVTKRNMFKNSIAHVGKITNLVLMCSITNTAHWLGGTPFRVEVTRVRAFRPRLCGLVVMLKCILL